MFFFAGKNVLRRQRDPIEDPQGSCSRYGRSYWPIGLEYTTAALCCSVLHCAALRRCAALFCTLQYCAALYCSVLHRDALYCTVLHCFFVLFCAAMCSTVALCSTLFYCDIFCCLTQHLLWDLFGIIPAENRAHTKRTHLLQFFTSGVT